MERADVVDCDIHSVVPSGRTLFPYLSQYWREVLTQSAFRGPTETPYPPNTPIASAPGTTPEIGAPSSPLARVQTQALDRWGAAVGILNCAYAIESIHNPDAAAAMASAVNDWHRAEWLDADSRLRASVLVPGRQPEMAAAEIDRVGDDTRFVQVYLPVRFNLPYGNRQYHPLYEAAVRHDLAIGLHFGGATGVPPTASGWPSYYIEEYAGMAQIFQSQMMSMIIEGVFDRFPTLRVVCIESGWTWLPSLMWRMDKEWKGLRREIPWVRRLPSDYMRDHFRFTLQPLDLPPNDTQTAQVLEEMDGADLLLFSSDYPHAHDTATDDPVPLPVSADTRARILGGNARAFYPRLHRGTTAPADAIPA